MGRFVRNTDRTAQLAAGAPLLDFVRGVDDRAIVRRPRRRTRVGALAGILLVSLTASAAHAFDHSLWDQLVGRYVDDAGRVAYRKLHSESAPVLERYLASLAAAKVDDLPPKEQLAFWINAYNAVIVAGILDGYSAESAIARYRLFKTYRRVISGEQRTPDTIEHRIIRARFADPRAHFALVCASTSCPVLRREAYRGERLDAQLDDQARAFLGDPTRNRIDAAAGVVELSAIFDWFRDDFSGDGRSLAAFLKPYLTPQQVALLGDTAPRYRDYDWTLNAQPQQRP